MSKAIKLANEYARLVPNDIHIPTLARMIEAGEVEVHLGDNPKVVLCSRTTGSRGLDTAVDLEFSAAGSVDSREHEFDEDMADALSDGQCRLKVGAS